MSFFCDFLKYFDISDISLKTTITIIVGVGISVVGNLKIKDIQNEFIELSSKREIVKIYGQDLTVKSISKGEIVVSGNIKNIEMESLCKS